MRTDELQPIRERRDGEAVGLILGLVLHEHGDDARGHD